MVNRNHNQYTVISTFAGCGGSSLGYKLAGYKELLAIDFDKHAVETFKLNFDCPIWLRDIYDISTQEILEFTNLQSGQLDVFDGSPPCQGFSTAGKRRVTDNRNSLFEEYVRLIDGLQPKVFVMENVPGMVAGSMKGLFIEIMKVLKSLPYKVKCKKMNSQYYGVPQARERLIFIGVRNDLNIEPSFPIPSKQIVTVREALKNVPIDDEVYKVVDKYKEFTRKIKPGKNGSSITPNKNFNTCRLHFNKPSCTIVKSISPRSIYAGILHPIENRWLTISEVKRLCSFPDDFKTVGKFEDQWARFGNAVMPKFMQAIAENIRVNILDRQSL